MPDNRIIQIGGIWAEDAADVPGSPVSETTYADSTLSEAEIQDGWPYDKKVDSSKHNEVMKRLTSLMKQIESWGILPYSILTDYGLGAWVMGSDGIIYKCIQINGPSSALKDPVSFSAFWKSIDEGVSTATASRIALRDASGKASFAPGTAGGEAIVFSQFANSLVANGYQSTPGLQFRFGYIAPASRNVELDLGAISFTPAFTNACLGVFPVLITKDTPGLTDNFLAIYGTPSKSSFRLYSGAPVVGPRTYGAFWFAIGY